MFEFPFDPDSLFPDVELARERRALRERWLAEGVHDGETLQAALATAAERDPKFAIEMVCQGETTSLTMAGLQRDALALASSFAQSSIMVLEKCPLMISSMCLWNKGRIISFNSSDNSKAFIFAGFDKRSIMLVIPPYFNPSVTVSQPY